VTGTKGKGTTATLISQILTASGQRAQLVGNIGRPALELLADIKSADVVIYELSSFQLWDIKQSPQLAVVLMIEPEHLDKHESLDDYVAAKSNIARWQSSDDRVIYHPSNKLSAKVAGVGLGKKLKYLSPQGAHIRDGQLVIEEQVICSVKDFGLLGEHNHENIAAALTASWLFSQDAAAAAKVIKGFKGLPHRLQIAAVKKGVSYVDDSFATTPATTAAAANSFTQPKVMIIGGSDKGSEYGGRAKVLAKSNIRRILLIGQMAPVIESELKNAGLTNYEIVSGGMDRIVARSAELAEAGDVVLLSPACASFDMFKDYIDRAEQFKAAVESL
jgi:UDP-N-acetylmuramoylalanine--D-glutamate ligase